MIYVLPPKKTNTTMTIFDKGFTRMTYRIPCCTSGTSKFLSVVAYFGFKPKGIGSLYMDLTNLGQTAPLQFTENNISAGIVKLLNPGE